MGKDIIREAENKDKFSVGSSSDSAGHQNVFSEMQDEFDTDLDFDLEADFDLEIPDGMADRIMAGAVLSEELEGKHTPDRIERAADDAVERISGRRIVPFTRAMIRDFGKYAASIAACLVLAIGMFTLSDASGLRIIGVGDDPASSVVSEEQTGSSGSAATEPGNVQTEDSQQSDTAAGSQPSVSSSSSGTASGSQNNASDSSSGGSSVSTPSSAGGSSSSVSSGSESKKNSGSSSNASSDSSESQSSSTSENQNDSTASDTSDDSSSTDSNQSSDNSDIMDNDAVRTVSSVSELQEYMNYQPPVPAVQQGWSISSIEVIYGETAQITYTDGNSSVIYRTAAGDRELNAGTSYESSETADGITYEGSSDGTVYLVSWKDSGNSYSLVFNSGTSREEALGWVSSVS